MRTPANRNPALPLLAQVRSTVQQYQMLAAGEGVLVALSGGPDSVALLAVLVALAAELGVRVHAAHLNHGLRGAESLRDETFAVAVARRLGVDCAVQRAVLSTTAANLEERARELRYAFLDGVARARGCSRIATGHTRDDQAETVVMRMMRGAGLDGLAGIHPVRDGRIIRPLIDCGRADVLAFLAAIDLTFCTDSSNRDLRFLRNRIRHEVLPLLESIDPGVVVRLAESAAAAASQSRQLDALLAAPLVAAIDPVHQSLRVQALTAIASDLHGRFVRSWLRRVRGHLRQLSAAHVEGILHIALGPRPNAQVDLPGGQLVVREYGRLRFVADTASSHLVPQRLDVDAPLVLPSGWRIHAVAGELSTAVRDPTLLRFVADADALAVPLVVRRSRPGDRVQPFGMQGHRKLQDLFVDRKIPKLARHATPVVESAGEIIWVPGVVRGSAAPVMAHTRRTLCLVAELLGIAGA